MTVMEKIKQQRRLLGMSQEELSKRAGVSLKTVQRWESGERSPSILLMPQIAEALNTTVGYLMEVDKNVHAPANLLPMSAEYTGPASLEDTLKQINVSSTEANIESSNRFPTMAYWGGVADNARKAVKSGQNLGLIYSLLSDAVRTVKAAMA